jgi:BppU N-terminal domain
MLIQPFEILQGNYGQTLNFVVTDGQGNIVNLTGASLNFKVQAADDPDETDVNLGGNPMTIDNPTSGTCHYTVAQGDFPNPGKFLAQIDVTVADASLISATGITINVLPGLPKANN